MGIKKNTSSSKKVKLNSGAYEDLFVQMANPAEKRRNILLSIKSSLIMQEEYDKVIAIRKQKAKVLEAIKKSMAKLDKDYAGLKKHLPNVKNVISATEKELGILDSQIDLYKEDIKVDSDNIQTNKSLKTSVKQKPQSVVRTNPNFPAEEKPKIIRPSVETKLDRIKNNLKVIEGKLKDL